MTAEEFAGTQARVGERLRMRFDDGHEVVARLVSVMVEADGSRHLIYNRVEWSSDADCYGASENTEFYAAGETLVSLVGVADGEELGVPGGGSHGQG